MDNNSSLSHVVFFNNDIHSTLFKTCIYGKMYCLFVWSLFSPHVINIYMSPLPNLNSSTLPSDHSAESGNYPHLHSLMPTGQWHSGTGISQACPRYSLPPAPGSPLCLLSLEALSPRAHDHRTKRNPLLLISVTMEEGYYGVAQHLLGWTIK